MSLNYVARSCLKNLGPEELARVKCLPRKCEDLSLHVREAELSVVKCACRHSWERRDEQTPGAHSQLGELQALSPKHSTCPLRKENLMRGGSGVLKGYQ